MAVRSRRRLGAKLAGSLKWGQKYCNTFVDLDHLRSWSAIVDGWKTTNYNMAAPFGAQPGITRSDAALDAQKVCHYILSLCVWTLFSIPC